MQPIRRGGTPHHASARRKARGGPLMALALVCSGALIAGCGGSSHGSPSAQTKGVSLVRAADVSSGAVGYRMNMKMDESVAGQNVKLTADGSFSPSSKAASMTMTMQLPSSLMSQTLQMQFVMDAGTVYVKLPASLAGRIPGAKPWLSMNLAQIGKLSKVPGLGSMMGSSSPLTNSGQYLDFLKAAAAGSVTDVGTQTIGGVQTTHYQAKIDVAKLPGAVPSADRAAVQKLVTTLEQHSTIADMPVDVWIDQGNLVRRLQLTFSQNVAGKSVAVKIVENFTDYGAQPAPTVPSAGQTTDLLSLLHL